MAQTQLFEAEQAVLGGVLQFPDALDEVLGVIRPEDFQTPAHGLIFKTMIELQEKSIQADAVTLGTELNRNNKLEMAGGLAYLAELVDSVVSRGNCLNYAKDVRELSLRRQCLAMTEGLKLKILQGEDWAEVTAQAEADFFKIADKQAVSAMVPAADLVNGMLERALTRREGKEAFSGMPTGYQELDSITNGLFGGDLIILAGRPSMGKTAFGLNVALRAGLGWQVPTAIFSLEMPNETLIERMSAVEAKIRLEGFRGRPFDDDEMQKLYAAADRIAAAELFLNDRSDLTTGELLAQCRKLKRQANLGLVVVDYLQLMQSSKRIDFREQEIADISRSLKRLAKELDVPVIALSQLNRKVEERTDKRPMLSDLRESGAIEQDADTILLVYRDDYYNKSESNPNKGITEIAVAKQRNGRIGTAKFTFLRESTRFENYTREREPEGSW